MNREILLIICNLLLSVGFISVFIGIFFFTYAKNIEENIIKTQSEFIASNLAKDIRLIIPKEGGGHSIRALIADNLNFPDMTEEDKKVENNNNQLRKKAYIVLVIGALLLTVLSFIIAKVNRFGFWKIIKNNLIILFFVFITEFEFLTYIGQNFISTDPNFVKNVLLKSIRDRISQ